MARQTITQITDDLDGSRNAQEVTFAYEGTQYTIDLSAKNKAAFERALKPYIEAATRVSTRSLKRQTSTRTATRRDLAKVRAWAREHGYTVSDRGRVSAEITKAYDAAH
jgi:hypothetical protein